MNLRSFQILALGFLLWQCSLYILIIIKTYKIHMYLGFLIQDLCVPLLLMKREEEQDLPGQICIITSSVGLGKLLALSQLPIFLPIKC